MLLINITQVGRIYIRVLLGTALVVVVGFLMIHIRLHVETIHVCTTRAASSELFKKRK